MSKMKTQQKMKICKTLFGVFAISGLFFICLFLGSVLQAEYQVPTPNVSSNIVHINGIAFYEQTTLSPDIIDNPVMLSTLGLSVVCFALFFAFGYGETHFEDILKLERKIAKLEQVTEAIQK